MCMDVWHRNVLVGDDGHKCVKLSDLGLSRTLTSSPYYLKSSNDKVCVCVDTDAYVHDSID